MPRPIYYVLLVLVALSLIPVGLMYKSRHSPKTGTRVQVVYDMDSQGYSKAQTASKVFADGVGMRHHPEGTVARGLLHEDKAYFQGVARDTIFTEEFPLTVTAPLMDRGQERFNIYCAPCHGLSGYGDGVVARRADRLQQGTWIPPSSLHVPPASTRSVGHLFNTVTNGIRSMPSYGSQIAVEDRWAIVAYVKALQRSQHASTDDVPPDKRSQLR